MEEVMKVLKQRCHQIDIWYKLYADDLVMIVSHEHIKEVISTLMVVS